VLLSKEGLWQGALANGTASAATIRTSLTGLLPTGSSRSSFADFSRASTRRLPTSFSTATKFGTQTLAGLALLIGRFVPLALTVLAPVITNIVAFHVWLAPSGLAVALFVAALELFLAWSYRDAFSSVLRARAEVAPVSGEAAPARRPHPQ
jgi:hypothetical protein